MAFFFKGKIYEALLFVDLGKNLNKMYKSINGKNDCTIPINVRTMPYISSLFSNARLIKYKKSARTVINA